MAKVKNLKIELQSGSDSTHFASWQFDSGASSSGSTSSGSVKVGDLVSIKSGATYYNGVAIPSWVMALKWYVTQVSGDRAVLGKDSSGAYNISSPINTKYLTGGTGTGSSSNSSSGDDASKLDYYEVKWYYDTGNNVWFSGGESNTKDTNATYSPPENTIKIKVSVKPVSKTYTSNNEEVSYWTGTAVTATYTIATNPPDKAGTPTVAIDKFTLTATLDNISDPRADQMQFQVYNGDKLFTLAVVKVLTCRAVFKISVKAGGTYRVRCRAINLYSTSRIFGEWGDFSNDVATIPAAVSGIKAVADSETSVKVTWKASSTATGYQIEYTENKLYFDTASDVQSMDVEGTTAYVTGLETGKEWFFRVRATNTQGESSWSGIVSVAIGSRPEAPTAWSLSSSVIAGEDIKFYWVHNTEDGSAQTGAQLNLDIGGAVTTTTIETTPSDDEEETTYSYTLSSSSYTEGTVIKWRIRTKGITNVYSPWSAWRTINVYAPPTLSLVSSVTEDDRLERLPFVVIAEAGPDTQTALSYHLSIIAQNSYETTDFTGEPVRVIAGTEVYSNVSIASGNRMEWGVGAGDLMLENGQEYTAIITASMDSGLTAQDSIWFYVAWEDVDYAPDASIAIDKDALTAHITPYCLDTTGALVENVSLAVYRREANGSFVLIGEEIQNDRVTTVLDPHPALDYARYRIVVLDSVTGSVSFEDLPGLPVGEPSIVIQWDESWSSFDYTEEDATEVPPWVGSMLKLPYNISVSESYDPDISLVEYIGRQHPVSYYGTQKGESASWSTVIPKTDKETLYGLRRLARWAGDVYVREPSGIGYWAQINVSMSSKYLDVTIPVSFDVTRVEGGI